MWRGFLTDHPNKSCFKLFWVAGLLVATIDGMEKNVKIVKISMTRFERQSCSVTEEHMAWVEKEEHVTCLSFPCMDNTDMLEQYSRTFALAAKMLRSATQRHPSDFQCI